MLHLQSVTFDLLNNLIDCLPQHLWWGDWFVPQRVLPGFSIAVTLSIDLKTELKPDMMIHAHKNHAI